MASVVYFSLILSAVVKFLGEFPLLAHPLPTSPQLFAHRRRAPSLARFFTRLLDLGLEKERKRLVRRLASPQLTIVSVGEALRDDPITAAKETLHIQALTRLPLLVAHS